ncbi:peptide/nickel transport system permease protein [Rhizobiales bacterium GAS191]|nr:peptide/nickel transport system permease protein [Rhizobiales bacterium GAS113]SEE23352.1 peptide/nickel transport system permease protein [Rhizobiales bacterium GAS188]SEE33860.1 peptide/nickel transport system permease protein [Rhizobiales bacterium GAS191]
MLRLIATRAGLGVLTLLAVSVLIFICTQILPGDVASAVLGQQATPDALRVFRLELGLDRPAYVRYFAWLFGVLRGDFGRALTNQRNIIEELWPRFTNTLFLAGYAAALAVPLAVGLGILSAIREGRFSDRISNVLTLIAISVPEFFVGYILIIIFSINLGWFPSLATVFAGMSVDQRLYVATLPALTLTMVVTAHMLRMTRNSVLSIMSTAYIEMAFLKGLSRSRVVSRHALPNAAGPIVSVVALNLAYLVVGVVVVENVFVYPGVGQYMVDAVAKRDVPVVQACGLVFAAVFVGLNTFADILAILVNPRLRHPR